MASILDCFDAALAAVPDKDFLRFREGNATYREFDETYRSLTSGIAGAGIGTGDIVPVFFPNSEAAVATWFALFHLGAVWVSMNVEFRGEQLAGALNLTESDTLIVDSPFVSQVLEVLPSLTHVRRLLVYGVEELPDADGVDVLKLERLTAGKAPARAALSREEVAMIVFTSGSTGVSKAVQLSHGYLLGQAVQLAEVAEVGEHDVYYCPYPLYHWDATVGTVVVALVTMGTAALAPRFSVSRFWEDIRRFGATVFDFMGATLTFIHNQPERPDDADNPVRLAWGVPIPPFKEEFERRFGLDLVEGYGSTEGGISVFQRLDKAYPPGSCGEVAPGFRLRILDDAGNELGPGQTGEIVTKPDDRNQMMIGYFRMPEANAEMLRGGWYHTGDLGRLDEMGNLYFVGRKKDVIRRRGENISALEIENVIERHPAVLEAAAYGVQSEYSEEEVAVAIVLHPGASLDRAELRDFCTGKMARYMIPEHIRFLDGMPKTPTEKVAKAELRKLHSGGDGD